MRYNDCGSTAGAAQNRAAAPSSTKIGARPRLVKPEPWAPVRCKRVLGNSPDAERRPEAGARDDDSGWLAERRAETPARRAVEAIMVVRSGAARPLL